MKKIAIIVCLVMLCVIISPGYAIDDSQFTKFITEMRKEMGTQAPEITVESQTVVIFIFALKNAMRKFKYDKRTKLYKMRNIRKIDTEPSEWDQEPIERIREAIATYESIGGPM